MIAARRSVISLIAAVALGLTAAPAALAQPAPTPAPMASEAVMARAQALFEEGDRLYNVAEYDQAIARFKEAYKVFPDPLFLYNIAQAYRQKGDCASARTFYRNYLRAAPEAENRARVEQRIAEMEACAPAAEPPGLPSETAGATPGTTPDTTTQPPAAPAPDVTAAPRPDAPAAAPPSRSPGRVHRIAGLATAGAGLALIGAGAWLGHVADDKAEALAAACTPACSANDATVRSLDEDGKRAELLAIVSWSAGGAALVGGAALAWWGWRDGREAPIAVAPVAGGAIVTAGVRF